MTGKPQLVAAAAGVVALTAALLIFRPKAGPVVALHPGYWRWAYAGHFQFVPCTIKPYTMFTDPETGEEGYFFADYNPSELQTDPAWFGRYAGQLGGNHSSAYFGYNGWKVPMDAQPITSNYWPGFPASVVGTPGPQDLCYLYHVHNTGACPVVSEDFYRTKIAANAQWQAGSNYYKPRRDAECNAPPGPTPTATAPPTPTPAPGPDPLAAWDEQLYHEGVTAGCGAGRFCPGEPLTREQAAVWFLKHEHGESYVPPPCIGLFDDAPCH